MEEVRSTQRIIILAFWGAHTPRASGERLHAILQHLPAHFKAVVLITRQFGNATTDPHWKWNYSSKAPITEQLGEHTVHYALPPAPTLWYTLAAAAERKGFTKLRALIAKGYRMLIGRNLDQDWFTDIVFHTRFFDKQLKVNSNDLIWVTGPPFEGFQAANWLHKRFKSKWVADYRDLWSGTDVQLSDQNFKYRAKQVAIELNTLASADAITTVLPAMQAALVKLFPEKKIILFPQGFNEYTPIETTFTLPPISLCYVGHMYDSQPVFQWATALLAALEQNGINPAQFQVLCIGTPERQVNSKVPSAFKPYITFLPWQSPVVLQQYLRSCNACIHLAYVGAQSVLSAKTMTYLASKKPVWVFDDSQSHSITAFFRASGQLVVAQNVADIAKLIAQFNTTQVALNHTFYEQWNYTHTAPAAINALKNIVTHKM